MDNGELLTVICDMLCARYIGSAAIVSGPFLYAKEPLLYLGEAKMIKGRESEMWIRVLSRVGIVWVARHRVKVTTRATHEP